MGKPPQLRAFSTADMCTSALCAGELFNSYLASPRPSEFFTPDQLGIQGNIYITGLSSSENRMGFSVMGLPSRRTVFGEKTMRTLSSTPEGDGKATTRDVPMSNVRVSSNRPRRTRPPSSSLIWDALSDTFESLPLAFRSDTESDKIARGDAPSRSRVYSRLLNSTPPTRCRPQSEFSLKAHPLRWPRSTVTSALLGW